MNWAELAERFLADARGRGLRPITRTGYRRILARFGVFWEQLGLERVADLGPEHLRRYRDQEGVQRSPASLKSELRPVLIALRWGLRQGLLLTDPGQDIKLSRVAPRPAAQFTAAQLERVLEGRWEGSPQGMRDRAILELFYGTGLRLGEAAALDLADLDLAECQLPVRHSKNGRARLVPLGSRLADRLRLYVEQARPWLGPAGHAALWLSPQGLLGASSLGLVVKRAAQRVGLTATAHDLRRAFATHLLAGGAQLGEIQLLLGHRQARTTAEHYAEVSLTRLARELRRTHPRARRVRARRRSS